MTVSVTVHSIRGLGLLTMAFALAGCDRIGLRNDAAGQDEPAAANTAAPANQANAAEPAASPPSAPAIASNGREYVALAAATDLFAIESARLALDKARSEPVRALAQAILDAHRGLTADLRTTARAVQPPVRFDPELNRAHRAQLDALRRVDEGAEFEEEYLAQQLIAHEEALTLVTAYASAGDAPILARHAARAAGIVYQNLSRVRSLIEQAPAQPAQ